MSNYFTILTDVGASAMALAAANNTPLNLSEIALGDGNGSVPVPGPSST
ncbi:phage tail protein, partial [Nitrosomonas marina]